MTTLTPKDRAPHNSATPIPDDIASEICEASNCGLPTGWPEYEDRDGDIWFETGETHDGDHVMMPAPSNLPLMLRRDAERLYGPLTPSNLSLMLRRNAERIHGPLTPAARNT